MAVTTVELIPQEQPEKQTPTPEQAHLKRLEQYDKLSQIILAKAFQRVQGIDKDGQWRHFSGVIKFRDYAYDVEFDFLNQADVFTFKDHTINLHERRIQLLDGISK